ncbi:MAG: hypothetical protein GX892_14330 [Thermoanaerobacteraceae bacterium]|nr:hypothetical protein [Thermoanaerobacteraceae bacterium]
MNRQQIEQEVKNYSVREATMAKIQKAGLPIPDKPPDLVEGVNVFTEWDNLVKSHGGIANIPFSILGDYLDKWTSIVSYARWVEAIADIDQATAREIRDTIKKQLYTIQDGGRELREALVHIEPLYREWEQKYVESLSMLIAVKALREGYERRADAISREITRRMNDVLDSRRLENRGGA